MMKHENTHVLALLIFYDNMKPIIYKVLVVVVYWLLDKYVCIDYLFLHKYKKSLSHRVFEDTLYDEVLVIGIHKFLLNIISCYGFTQDDTPTVIFTCKSKLVSY